MRKTLAFTLAACLAVPAMARAEDSGQTRKEIDKMAALYDGYYNGKNANDLGALWAKDGVFILPGTTVKGRESIQKFYQSRFDGGAVNHKTTVEDVSELGDNTALAIETFSVDAPGKNGQTMHIQGRLAVIYVHPGNEWRIRALSVNLNPAK